MRVAALQVAPRSDAATSAAHHLELLRAAADDGARLAVLPEGALLGFARTHAEAVAAAQPLDGPYVTSLRELSSARGLAVAGHLYELAVHGTRQSVHNTTVVVDGDRVLGTYRKLHLFDAQGFCESAVVDPGDVAQLDVPPMVVDGVVLGVVTCFDLRFGELAVALARRGASLLLAPSAWVAGAGKRAQFDVLVAARAIETGCYVATAALPGPRWCGGSCIVSPTGVHVAEVVEGEGIAAAEIDSRAVSAARAATPTLRHRPAWGIR